MSEAKELNRWMPLVTLPLPAPLTLCLCPAPGKAVRLWILCPGEQGGATEEVTGRHTLLDGPRAHLPPSLRARGEPEGAGCCAVSSDSGSCCGSSEQPECWGEVGLRLENGSPGTTLAEEKACMHSFIHSFIHS